MLVIDFIEEYQPDTLQILVDSHLVNIDFKLFGCSKLLAIFRNEKAELISFKNNNLIIQL